MTVAVTGGSGHLGSNLVRQLLDEGRKVRCLVREDTRSLDGLDVELVKGDLQDVESLKKLFTGVDTVFHLAARISIVGSEGGLVEKTNINGVKNVIDAALECGVKKLIHTSSIHAFNTNPNDETIDETRPLVEGEGHMAYDLSKSAGQRLVVDAVKNRGLKAVICNPGAVIGPNDFKKSRVGSVILDIYHRDMPALIDGGYNWVDARDVAAGIIAAEKKGKIGECYLLTGHWHHITDISKMIQKITGRKTPTAATPMWLAMFSSYFVAAWAKLWGTIPKFTPEAMWSLQKHRYISHEKASKDLGYSSRPTEETIKDTLDWFKDAGMLRN
jgi:dihydroflavonol-4-reductase